MAGRSEVIYKCRLKMILQNVNGDNSKHTLERIVTIAKESSDYYGNGCHMLCRGAGENDTYEEFFDCRYDKRLRTDNLMIYVLEWASGYYSGENGSWKLVGVTLRPLKV